MLAWNDGGSGRKMEPVGRVCDTMQVSGPDPSCERHHPCDLPTFRRTPFASNWSSLGERKMPAAANSHEPEPEAENRTRYRHRRRRELQYGTDHDHGSAGQCGERVKIGA